MEEIDQIFTVLLSTSMAVGGIIALILDNIIPGTPEERGIQKWRNLVTSNRGKSTASIHVYDLPFGLTNKWEIAKYIPFLPYHAEQRSNIEIPAHGTSNRGADEDVQVNIPPKTGNLDNTHL